MNEYMGTLVASDTHLTYGKFENFKFTSLRWRNVVSVPCHASRRQQRCLPHVWF